MAKTEQLNDLCERWKTYYSNNGIDARWFCKDGIIDEINYVNSKVKLLFILRETNNYPDEKMVNQAEEADLRELLKDGPRYQVFHTVARWASGILENFLDFGQADNYENMKRSLSQIAVMNLKKYTGKAIADFNLISAFANFDEEFIREEVEIIAPNFVISCGVFNDLQWALGVDPINPLKPFEKLPRYNNAVIINWEHPSRKDNSRIYLELKSRFMKYVDH